ncbi:Uncharacterised protein [Pseudoalteromonas nigrifaciens]|nr:Uncharacterised protein [Pseudoalteromonas nigrifaciens]
MIFCMHKVLTVLMACCIKIPHFFVPITLVNLACFYDKLKLTPTP